MKKIIFYSLLFLFSFQLNAQRDQTLFSGTKLDQSGSWAGFSYTPTEIAGQSSTQILEFKYNTFYAGYSFQTYRVIHPYLSIGLGPGKLKVNGDNDKLLVMQPSAGVEINVFRWMRVGMEGGYRLVTGTQGDRIENEDLSN